MRGNLILTVAQAENQELWEKTRMSGIGGSDVASVVGRNRWMSPYKLWAIKTGTIEPDDLSDNEAVYWGREEEEIVAKRFTRDTGKKVRKCGMLQDEEYPFFLANIDRWLDKEKVGLEIKTASYDDEWKDDEVPEEYYCQCQWYMGVTGAKKWYIAVKINNRKFIWKEIPRNEDDIKYLRESALNFWQNNVLAGVSPDVDGCESTTEVLRKQYEQEQGMEVALPSAAAVLLERWDELKQIKAQADAELTEIQNRLMACLGLAKKGTIGDRVVTWSNQKGRETVSVKDLKQKYPDVYRELVKVSAPSRRFSVK